MNLGEMIKTLREEVGISVPDLAAKCKVTPTHLYDIQNGTRNPSEKLLNLIAVNLDADLGPLLDLMRKRKELVRRVRRNPEEFEALMLEGEK